MSKSLRSLLANGRLSALLMLASVGQAVASDPIHSREGSRFKDNFDFKMSADKFKVGYEKPHRSKGNHKANARASKRKKK